MSYLKDQVIQLWADSHLADLHFNARQWELAIRCYSMIITAQPNATSYLKRAICYGELGRAKQELSLLQAAAMDITAVIRLVPEDAQAPYLRGNCYANMYDLTKSPEHLQLALADLSKSIELAPRFAAAYGVRLGVHVALAHWKHALEDSALLAQIRPLTAEEAHHTGVCHLKLRRPKMGLAYANQSLALKPNSRGAVNALMLRGQSLYALRKLTKSVEDLSRAIELLGSETQNHNTQGTLGEAFFYRGMSYYRRASHYGGKKGRVAIEDYAKAIADFDKAIQLLEATHTKNSVCAQAYLWRGCASKKSIGGLNNKAIEALTKAIEIGLNTPDRVLAYGSRGECYIMLNRPVQAIDDYSRALELEVDNATILTARAQAYMDLKSWQEAIDDLTRLVDLPPDTQDVPRLSQVYRLRTECYEALGLYTEAAADEEFADQLAEDNEEDPEDEDDD